MTQANQCSGYTVFIDSAASIRPFVVHVIFAAIMREVYISASELHLEAAFHVNLTTLCSMEVVHYAKSVRMCDSMC